MAGWTQQQIDVVIDLWNQGLRAREIGERIGRSKNAVIGKAHRLGLVKRGSPLAPDAETRFFKKGQGGRKHWRQPLDRHALQAAAAIPVLSEDDGASEPVQLGQPPEPRTCLWPTGGGPYSFDCTARRHPGQPYCTEHCRRAYLIDGKRWTPEADALLRRHA